MLRKQFTVGRINNAAQKNLNSVITKVRTEVHDLNGSAAFDRDAFRRFHYNPRDDCPLITTLNAVLPDRTISRTRHKSSMRHSHRRIATLKLREPDDVSTKFDCKTHGSQITAERRKLPHGVEATTPTALRHFERNRDFTTTTR